MKRSNNYIPKEIYFNHYKFLTTSDENENHKIYQFFNNNTLHTISKIIHASNQLQEPLKKWFHLTIVMILKGFQKLKI